MSHDSASLGRSRAERSPDAELDALVAAEFAELQPRLRSDRAQPVAVPADSTQAGEPIEVELDRLAQRLRGHPDRVALIERLQAASLDEVPMPGEAPPASVTFEAPAPQDPE